MRTAKTLIRLGGCPGWFESSLGAHAILFVLSWGGSCRDHTSRCCAMWQPQEISMHNDIVSSVFKRWMLYFNRVCCFQTLDAVFREWSRFILFIKKHKRTQKRYRVYPPLHAPRPHKKKKKKKNKKKTRTFLENVDVSLILRERQLSFNTFAVFGYF